MAVGGEAWGAKKKYFYGGNPNEEKRLRKGKTGKSQVDLSQDKVMKSQDNFQKEILLRRKPERREEKVTCLESS